MKLKKPGKLKLRCCKPKKKTRMTKPKKRMKESLFPRKERKALENVRQKLRHPKERLQQLGNQTVERRVKIKKRVLSLKKIVLQNPSQRNVDVQLEKLPLRAKAVNVLEGRKLLNRKRKRNRLSLSKKRKL